MSGRSVEREVRQLVARLRKRNEKAEQRGGVQLPDGEYAALERELTERLARRAAAEN
jgi:hypothetical protein